MANKMVNDVYLEGCSSCNELMRPFSLVWIILHLKIGTGGKHRIVGREKTSTDLVVCFSVIGVVAEPTHDFDICVKVVRKKETLIK